MSPFDLSQLRKSDKSVQNVLEVCSRLLFSPFQKLEYAILSFIVTIHHDIWQKHIASKTRKCVFIPSWSFTSTVLKEMNNLPRLPQIFIGNWAATCYSCGWIRVAAFSSPSGWIQVTTESNSGGWIQVTAESIIRLTRVPAAAYGLRPTPYHGWLDFR